MADESVYLSYITATPEEVWDAITDADLTGQFWGHSNVSDWRVGSVWTHVRTDGSGIVDVAGRVVASERPHALSITFAAPQDPDAPGASVVQIEIAAGQGIVELRITVDGVPPEAAEDALGGWTSVMANLKSLLETGEVMPQAPWELHAQLQATRSGGRPPES